MLERNFPENTLEIEKMRDKDIQIKGSPFNGSQMIGHVKMIIRANQRLWFILNDSWIVDGYSYLLRICRRQIEQMHSMFHQNFLVLSYSLRAFFLDGS